MGHPDVNSTCSTIFDTMWQVPPANLLPPIVRAAGAPSYFVETCHFSKLSVSSFRHRLNTSSCPLIIKGLGDYMLPYCSGSLSFIKLLKETLGPDCPVPVSGKGNMKWHEFLERVNAGEKLYIADVSI